jgi:hypothetical protein
VARCGCGSGTCNCSVQAGAGITVEGNGTPASPYVVSSEDVDLACTDVMSCVCAAVQAGDGLTCSATTLSVQPSTDAGNQITVGSDGRLYAGTTPGTPADPWHVVGAVGEPPFGAGWTNTTPGTGAEGTNNHSTTRYRMVGRLVELRGMPGRASGSGTIMFNLPPAYRPTNNLSFVVTNGLSTALAEVRVNGDVVVVTAPNPGNGITLDAIKFTI